MPSQSVVDKFLLKHGGRGGRVVSALAKHSKFKTAIETEVGQELLGDVVGRMDEILVKIIDDNDTPEERAEFRALKGIAEKWQDKLAAYTRAVMQIANNKI